MRLRQSGRRTSSVLTTGSLMTASPIRTSFAACCSIFGSATPVWSSRRVWAGMLKSLGSRQMSTFIWPTLLMHFLVLSRSDGRSTGVLSPDSSRSSAGCISTMLCISWYDIVLGTVAAVIVSTAELAVRTLTKAIVVAVLTVIIIVAVTLGLSNA